MAPKRKSKKSLSETLLTGDAYDSDDSMRTSSSMATANSIPLGRTNSQLSNNDGSVVDQSEKLLEDLMDKRASIRETALVKLVRALSNYQLQDVIEEKAQALVEILLKLLKKNEPENYLSAQILALLWICVGSSPAEFELVIPALKSCARNGSDMLKESALNALGIIVFLEELLNQDVCEFLQYFQDIVEDREQSSKVMVAALNCYGLLYLRATSRPNREDFNVMLDRYMELLDDNDIDVRISAGENIALVLADRDSIVQDQEIEEEESYFERYHELVLLLQQLATDHTRSKSKKERSFQKASFRDILLSVEKGTRPEITMRFKDETITLDDWGKIRQMEAFKEAIGEGLTTHFHNNHVLKKYFDWYDTQMGSGKSKAFTQGRKELRAAKFSGY